jgi:hypothetical protein
VNESWGRRATCHVPARHETEGKDYPVGRI